MMEAFENSQLHTPVAQDASEVKQETAEKKPAKEDSKTSAFIDLTDEQDPSSEIRLLSDKQQEELRSTSPLNQKATLEFKKLYVKYHPQLTADEKRLFRHVVEKMKITSSTEKAPSYHRLFKACITVNDLDLTWIPWIAMRILYMDARDKHDVVRERFRNCSMAQRIKVRFAETGVDVFRDEWPAEKPSRPESWAPLFAAGNQPETSVAPDTDGLRRQRRQGVKRPRTPKEHNRVGTPRTEFSSEDEPMIATRPRRVKANRRQHVSAESPDGNSDLHATQDTSVVTETDSQELHKLKQELDEMRQSNEATAKELQKTRDESYKMKKEFDQKLQQIERHLGLVEGPRQAQTSDTIRCRRATDGAAMMPHETMPPPEPSYANGPYTSQRFSLPSTSSIKEKETDTKDRISLIFEKGVAAALERSGVVPNTGPVVTQALLESRLGEADITLRSIIDSLYNPLAERVGNLEEQYLEIVDMVARRVIDFFESGVGESG